MHEETTTRDLNGKTGRELLWEMAISAMLDNCRVTDAAEQIGISLSTLRRLLKDPEFAQHLRNVRRQRFASAITHLQIMTEDAASMMYECLRSDNLAVKLRASQLIIHYALHGLEVLELDQRLRVIEVSQGFGHT